MNQSDGHIRDWLWLTVPITLLLIIAAGFGVLHSDLYRHGPFLVGRTLGQDVVSLALVLPILVASAWHASRGSPRALQVWLGVLIYLVYTYVVAAFDDSYNWLSFVYVGLLWCSLYGLISTLVTVNAAEIKARFTEKTPVKAVSVYLGLLAVAFFFLWSSRILPDSIGEVFEPNIDAFRMPGNGVHVLDMAWILPALLITSVGLWRRLALGYTLAGAMLSAAMLLSLATASMVVLAIREGPAAMDPTAVIVGVLSATTIAMLFRYLVALKSPPIPTRLGRPANSA